MDDYYDFDERNARVTRPPSRPMAQPVYVPAPSAGPRMPAPVPQVAAPAVMGPAPMVYAGQPPMTYGAPYGYPQYSPPAPYPQPYGYPQGPYPQPYGYPPYNGPHGAPPHPYYSQEGGGSGLGGILGKVKLGDLVEVAAAAYAALQELPPAPVATDDVATNLANIITHQAELAKHAKLNERVRTAGTVLGKFFG